MTPWGWQPYMPAMGGGFGPPGSLPPGHGPMPMSSAPPNDPALNGLLERMTQRLEALETGGNGRKKERRKLFGPALQMTFIIFLFLNTFVSHLWVPRVEAWFWASWRIDSHDLNPSAV